MFYSLFLNLCYLIASEETGILHKSLLHKFLYVPQILIVDALVVLCARLYTLTLSLNLVLPTPISPIYSFKQPEQMTAYMTLKLLQDVGGF